MEDIYITREKFNNLTTEYINMMQHKDVIDTKLISELLAAFIFLEVNLFEVKEDY